MVHILYLIILRETWIRLNNLMADRDPGFNRIFSDGRFGSGPSSFRAQLWPTRQPRMRFRLGEASWEYQSAALQCRASLSIRLENILPIMEHCVRLH